MTEDVSPPGLRCQSGFTLIEVLVTLVLTALITTVIMQGLGYLWRLQAHYDQLMIDASVQDMRMGWWRQSVRGLLATRKDNPHRFSGQRQRFIGLSTEVPGQASGVPGAVEWRIEEQGNRAVLRGNGQQIIPLPRGSYFSYLDSQRKAHPEWSPAEAGKPPLPSAILIMSDGKILWAASPLQPQFTPLPSGPVLGGDSGKGGFVS